MEIRGKVTETHFDMDHNFVIQITAPRLQFYDLPQFDEEEMLDIVFKKHKEKRSLNANSYFHLLCGKLAEKQGISLSEVKNMMIAQYGEIDKDDDGNAIHVIMADDIDWRKLDYIHLHPTTKTNTLDNGKVYRVFLVMRGSHTYNTKEMASLISGLCQECKEADIETLTPNEILELAAKWGERWENKHNVI